ncbi:MAG: PH domain-containing protein [Bacilli bacterium]
MQQYRAPKEARSYWYTKNIIQTLIAGVIILIANNFLSMIFENFGNQFTIAGWILFGLFVLNTIIQPIIVYRTWGYHWTEKQITYYHGVYVKHETIIPIVRVQHASVVQGPIQGQYGLCDVNISTSNGSHEIQAVNYEVGLQFVRELTAYIEHEVEEEKRFDEESIQVENTVTERAFESDRPTAEQSVNLETTQPTEPSTLELKEKERSDDDVL